MNKETMAAFAAIGGATAGAFAGYFVAMKRLTARYEVLLEEENERTKQFYSRLNKTGDYADPVTAAEVLVADAAEAVRSYDSDATKGETMTDFLDDDDVDVVRVEDYVRQNIFEESGDEAVLNPEDRDPTKPYVISEEEWVEGQDQFDHVNLTYYAGDNVLCDDEDGAIEMVDDIVGVENLSRFGIGTSDPLIVFVRNTKISTDFEIRRREDKFSVVVLAFDEQQNHIQHSDEPMPRRRKLRD